jgi:hypothetical protein
MHTYKTYIHTPTQLNPTLPNILHPKRPPSLYQWVAKRSGVASADCSSRRVALELVIVVEAPCPSASQMQPVNLVGEHPSEHNFAASEHGVLVFVSSCNRPIALVLGCNGLIAVVSRCATGPQKPVGFSDNIFHCSY